jgi:small-conductance mechanosensitive channel
VASSKLNQPWIPVDKIEPFVQMEPAIVILGLVFSAWITAKLLLRNIPYERKNNLGELFRNLGIHLSFGLFLFISYLGLQQIANPGTTAERVMTYVGFSTILVGATVFVKVWRIIVLEYLFLSHRSVAFPALLVNLFTLLLSLVLAGWLGAEIFNIHLTPILATSAIFSLVLGLALQDTLGNLFAGVALQFDKPYEIGDWIEVHGNGQKWVGQVHDISWRATVLIGHGEEYITVPNRLMSQAEISNFATKSRPIMRSLSFKLPYKTDPTFIKHTLIDAAKSVPDVKKSPLPRSVIAETTESWITYRLGYFIEDYGAQFSIADQIYIKVVRDLKAAGIELAGQRVIVSQSESESTLQELNEAVHSRRE